MARAFKQGLDYFPLDVDLDDKFSLIEAEFGIQGFGIIVRLWQKIYKAGYYYDWGKKEQLLFSKSVNVDINRINVIIKAAVEWKLFSETILNEYNILTSHGIQKRYFGAISRREKVHAFKELLLIDISDYKNAIIANINHQNDDTGTQSTVQYSTLNPPTPLLGGNSQNSENKKSEFEEKPSDLKPLSEPKKSTGGKSEVYATRKKKTLHGDRLQKFNKFWRDFNYPEGKAAAADAWLEIENFDEVYPKIIKGAQAEAKRRPEILAKKQTPKMAQGWISGKRWEDFIELIPPIKTTPINKSWPNKCLKCGKEAMIMPGAEGLCRPCYTGKTEGETKKQIENLIEHAIGGVA